LTPNFDKKQQHFLNMGISDKYPAGQNEVLNAAIGTDRFHDGC
jgi:hypothetical protein